MKLIKHDEVNLNTDDITGYYDIGVHMYPTTINGEQFYVFVQNEERKEYQIFIIRCYDDMMVGIGYYYDYRGLMLEHIQDFINTTTLAVELEEYLRGDFELWKQCGKR